MPSRSVTVASDGPTEHDENMESTTNNGTPPTNEELLDLLEQFEQRIKLLTQANADLRSQLSAALASNHTPLLRFGAGTATVILNARAIEAIYLKEGVTISDPPMPSGQWQVMVDQRRASEYLEPGAALDRLLLVEKQWIEALEPPE